MKNSKKSLEPSSGDSFERLREAARNAGFECLSKVWCGWQESYSFRCAQGHQCKRSATMVVFHALTCRECLDNQQLVHLQEVVHARGGRCLERKYLGAHAHHRFVCAEGHHWQVRASNIINKGSWCRQCAQIQHSARMRHSNGLGRLQSIAAERGGKCLTESYTLSKDYYHFECARGHQWWAEGSEIVRGRWCAHCDAEHKSIAYRLPDGLERMVQMAKRKGGQCLAHEYLGMAQQYPFRCKNGHEWNTTGQRIFNGAWCLQCANDSKKLSIENMHEMAQARGGLCISTTYINSTTKLEWECHLGHRWHALQGSIRKGHWCPSCAFMNQIRKPNSCAMAKYISSSRHAAP
jgi:hypothetical protein